MEKGSAMAKHRVIFAITHTTAGGLRELWQDLADGLRERGLVTELMAFYPPLDAAGLPLPAPGWHYLAPARPGSAGAVLALLGALARYLRAHAGDTVVSAMPLANTMLAAVGCVAGHDRLIVTHHTPVETYGAGLRRLDRLTARLPGVRSIVAVSRAVEHSFAALGQTYRRKLTTIHNALPKTLDTDLAAMRERYAARDGQGPVRLAAIGRLSRQKNYPVVLRALALLPGVVLDIYGEGEDEAALRVLADELALGERAVFHGLLPRHDVLNQAAQADIFVQMSLFEGHSLALIEAAKLGLPLVVSDVESQVEGVTRRDGERCGIVVGSDDHQALAQAIRTLAEDPAHRALWAARAQRLGEDSSMDDMVLRYEALIASAATRQGAAHV